MPAHSQEASQLAMHSSTLFSLVERPMLVPVNAMSHIMSNLVPWTVVVTEPCDIGQTLPLGVVAAYADWIATATRAKFEREGMIIGIMD